MIRRNERQMGTDEGETEIQPMLVSCSGIIAKNPRTSISNTGEYQNEFRELLTQEGFVFNVESYA